MYFDLELAEWRMRKLAIGPYVHSPGRIWSIDHRRLQPAALSWRNGHEYTRWPKK